MYAHTDKLKVWQKAHQLVLRIYEVTKQFPEGELFALTSQLRRARPVKSLQTYCNTDSYYFYRPSLVKLIQTYCNIDSYYF